MENIRPIDFFKNLNHYSKFERVKMIYDYTDKLNPLLVMPFFDEYEEYKQGLLEDITNLSVLHQGTYTPPKITEEGDFYKVEFYFDSVEPIAETINQINSSVEFDPQTDNIKRDLIKEPDPLDLSDSNAVEKIIYLNELGIIDFLRTKAKAGISNGGLASVLSGITGVKPETLKPSLNRLSNNDTADKNHPYSTQKTVDKIKIFLTKLGF